MSSKGLCLTIEGGELEDRVMLAQFIGEELKESYGFDTIVVDTAEIEDRPVFKQALDIMQDSLGEHRTMWSLINETRPALFKTPLKITTREGRKPFPQVTHFAVPTETLPS